MGLSVWLSLSPAQMYNPLPKKRGYHISVYLMGAFGGESTYEIEENEEERKMGNRYMVRREIYHTEIKLPKSLKTPKIN